METLEQLKAIISGKPIDGKATHIEGDGTYISEGVNVDEAMIGGNWCDIRRLTCTRSLSDIERIIELMELNQNMHTTVAGYLWGKDWAHWNEFNAGKFEL